MYRKLYTLLCLSIAISSIFFGVNVIAKEKVTNEKIVIEDKLVNEYIVDLNKFNIKNDGTSHIETSKGINEALQFAKQNGFQKVVFPKGIYLIDEKNPIVLDMKNMIIDLNGSTFQINTNGLDRYSIVEFKEGAENLRLTNGIIRGDKDTHDYTTIKSSHEWGCGVIFRSGTNLEMDNVTVSNVPGYGIGTESGNTNTNNRFHEVSTTNLELGGINANGAFMNDENTIRTKKSYDISMVGGAFELGYTLGYQGYPVLKNKEYVAYFYDKNMNFIEAKNCIQYRKVSVPKNSVYVNFKFNQNFIPSNTQNWAGWITNLKPPTNVKLRDCVIKENRSLGLAFCGGQKWTIENNLFEKNGGNSPGYAIDLEDGWDLMQDILFKNNRFLNNVSGDVVSCAGDNIVFEGNDFTNHIYMKKRTTNYKFLTNKFSNNVITYENSSTMESSANVFKNSLVKIYPSKDEGVKTIIQNENFINTSIDGAANPFGVINSKITNNVNESKNNIRLTGIYKNCDIRVNGGYLNADLYNCNIENTTMHSQLKTNVQECIIKNSTIRSHSNTESIKVKSSKIIDSMISTSTWGGVVIVDVQESEIIMENAWQPTIDISAGRMKNLIFSNNVVKNSTNKPVFSMSDTTYTMPNGNILIEKNNITQIKHHYIFDGVNINKGVVNFTERENTLTGSEMLNPKYINNQYFKIIN